MILVDGNNIIKIHLNYRIFLIKQYYTDILR